MISTAVLLALSVAPLAAQASEPRLERLDQRGLELGMARLATEFPALVTVIPVGESRQGRRVEALRVAAGELTPGRPALLLVANLDGPWVWTSSLALDHVRRLASRYAGDERVKRLLDTTTLYVIPRADADAAEASLAVPRTEQWASGTGVDDDRDGRTGEDPPRDVDGDGVIAWMRVPHEDGRWMPDPLDPRASVEADAAKGQRGVFKLVREGRDADKDERISEDQELDAVLNRNFPQGWAEHDPAAGRFATDEPVARALCDFVLLHRDIALVLAYGSLDSVAEKPKAEAKQPGRSANPSAGVPEADASVLAELGKRYAAAGKAVKGDGKDAGTFQAWVQAQRGLWTVNVCPWSLPLDEPGPKKDEDKKGDAAAPPKKEEKESPSDEVKRLRWIDAHGEGARFLPWKKFAHPDLGEVEIGGFAPFARIEPPDGEAREIAEKNTEALLVLLESLPRLGLERVGAKDLGEGLWELEATLVNEGLLPHASALGMRSQNVRPARVALDLPRGATLLAGNPQELVRELAGSGGQKELRWLVRGSAPSGLAIVLDTDFAGSARVVPEVK